MPASPFRFTCLSIALLALSALPALSEPLTIDGTGISRDVHCAGNDVEIYGANNTIKLTGKCASVMVGGVQQTVDIAAHAGKLDVSGSGHKIAGAASALVLNGDNSTLVLALGGAETEADADIAGDQHMVELTLQQPAKLDVQGLNQQVTWTLAPNTPEPKISISGADNKVERKE